MELDEFYETLYRQKLCDSAYDFSVRFLGKSQSYYSVIKARHKEPSIEAISALEVALKNKSKLYSDRHPILTRTRYLLIELSDKARSYREQKTNDLLCRTE